MKINSKLMFKVKYFDEIDHNNYLKYSFIPIRIISGSN